MVDSPVDLRKHFLTGEPILFAPERASRPRAFAVEDRQSCLSERCPFCPGHESDTPPEIARIGDPWRIRVVPNKYPSIDGAEVIVESPEHHERFDRVAHAEDVVRVYLDRYRAHEGAAYTAIFKNSGPRAGSSIPHVHSQVMPLPFVPPRVERELAAFASGCPFCAPAPRQLVIRETETFLWFAPYGSTMPYHQCIVPRRHVAAMTELAENEVAELAALLRSASAATLRVGESFNWMFLSFPRGASAHAYVELFPRLTAIAGFELGTGTFVEIIDPAAAAERLRIQ